MKIAQLTVITALFTLCGCLDFGKTKDTLTPSSQEIKNSRKELHLNKNLQISILGYKKVDSGLDQFTWIKFTSKSKKLEEIIESDFLNQKTIKKIKFYNHPLSPTWWPQQINNLEGIQIHIPPSQTLNLFISNQNDESIVYMQSHRS